MGRGTLSLINVRLLVWVVTPALVGLNWLLALVGWQLVHKGALGASTGRLVPLLALVALLISGGMIHYAATLPRSAWLTIWLLVMPWLLASVSVFFVAPLVPILLLVGAWGVLGWWVHRGWWPFAHEPQRSPFGGRFATRREMGRLLTGAIPWNALLVGKLNHSYVAVQPEAERPELGNLLITGPSRAGKGLMNTAQLLSWQGSAIVNDLKGEFWRTTAGYRATLGPVYLIDPRGVGHRFDPLASRVTDQGLFTAARALVDHPGDRDPIFADRAARMLKQMFLAARMEGMACLPYTYQLMNLPLSKALDRLHQLDPRLAERVLDAEYGKAKLDGGFLTSAWSTITTRLEPILTEQSVRLFTASDFCAEQLLTSERPVTVYLRWHERDLKQLAPLVRLVWDSLIGDLVEVFDERDGQGCHPVLLLVEEAGRTAIPSLVDYAATVLGRGVHLSVVVQSLAQLKEIYGDAGAQVLRDNMETQIFYPPTDPATSTFLEERLGQIPGLTRSTSRAEDGRVFRGPERARDAADERRRDRADARHRRAGLPAQGAADAASTAELAEGEDTPRPPARPGGTDPSSIAPDRPLAPTGRRGAPRVHRPGQAANERMTTITQLTRGPYYLSMYI